MREVINIDERLIDDARAKAMQHGYTLAEWIESLVKRSLQGRVQDAPTAGEFELVTFGRDGQFTQLDIDKTSALFEQEDLARYQRTSGS